MPQPSASSSNQYNSSYGRGNNKSRPKGITMEDLKKQTALRLAQEQNQGNNTNLSGGGNNGNGGDPCQVVIGNQVPVPMTLPPQQRGNLYHRNNMYGGVDPYIDPSMYQPPAPQSHHHPRHHPMMSRAPVMYPAPPTQQQRQQQRRPPSLVQQHPGGYATSGYGSYASGAVPSNDIHEGPHGYPYMVPMPVPPRPVPLGVQQQQARPISVNSTQQQQQNIKNKLPHGLTVHELKEMTKARLQAEAAEKSDVEVQGERGVSPLDFDGSSTSGGQRERVMSRDSTGQNSPAYVQNQTAPTTSDASRGMEGAGLQAGQPPTLRSMNRSDTWDSVSIASHNSNALSENFGSDSASEVNSSIGGGNRMRSFTVPALPSVDTLDTIPSKDLFSKSSSTHASPATFGSPTFDATVGGNRRRAVTLSPHTSSISEDRPHHDSWVRSGDRLTLPSFSSGGAAPIQARQREYSPVLEQLGLEESFLGGGGANAGVFGSSFSDFQSTNATDFLREAPSTEMRVPAPPPGFSSSESVSIPSQNNGNTAFSRVGSVEIVHEGFLGGDKNRWDAPGRHHLASVDNLASDLGSLLNFSQAERLDRERANTYTFGSSLTSSVSNNNNDTNKSFISEGFVAKDLDAFQY